MVCDDGTFAMEEASTVCRQLGYNPSESQHMAADARYMYKNKDLSFMQIIILGTCTVRIQSMQGGIATCIL